MKKIFFILSIFINGPLVALDNSQFYYQMVKLLKVENKDFRHTAEDGEVYTDIAYPTCKPQGEPEIDIGDFYLGPDCFYGNPQFVKVINQDHGWRIQIPICYASHTFRFFRTIKLFCKYPELSIEARTANKGSMT